MRRLATELAAARGALDVGFLVTVSPKGDTSIFAFEGMEARPSRGRRLSL